MRTALSGCLGACKVARTYFEYSHAAKIRVFWRNSKFSIRFLKEHLDISVEILIFAPWLSKKTETK